MAEAIRGNFASAGEVPPIHRIDLSLPPSERYVELSKLYCDQLRSLTGLFNELVSSLFPNRSAALIERAARVFLRRLSTHEETEEIRGISRVTGIDMYLLVSFNVLLDLLMGCTSGAALTENRGEAPKMLHFRTLDWNMDGLRRLIVQLEFVRSPDTKTVLATSITYVGFVGILTGVRQGLSVSLNFRPNHNASSFWEHFRFYGNHILVLLGVRRSISSLLRQCILPSGTSPFLRLGGFGKSVPQPEPISLEIITKIFPAIPTTAAYLIFCDGTSAVTMEKDLRSAIVHSSSSFIVATNSDFETTSPSYVMPGGNHNPLQETSNDRVSMAYVIQDSNERRACMQKKWDNRANLQQAQPISEKANSTSTEIAGSDPLKRTRLSKRVSASATQNDETPSLPKEAATPVELINWTTTYPTTNEMTHFTTIMDPIEGKVLWLRRFLRPLNCNAFMN